MFKVEYKGRPKPAERPRARFAKDNKSYYLYSPPTYAKYKDHLIQFFNKFSEEKEFQDLFDPKNINYGLSLKTVFRLKGNGKNIFYAKRPDIDNLFKGVQDAIFQSEVNQIEDGYLLDKEGSKIVSEDGEPLIKYRSKIDDSRVVHAEQLKLRVDTEEEEGIIIILRNIGKEDIE